MNTNIKLSGLARRVTLLLGSPRSGTSWLAKILDTHPNVFYTHEPLFKAWVPQVNALVEQLKTRGLSPEERLLLIDGICRARHHHVKPPFFPKSFITCPPFARGTIWKAMHVARWGRGRFARWFSPSPDGGHELLVKEIDWQGYVPHLLSALQPNHFVVIIRHAGAVVSSRLVGFEKGLMGSYRTGWLECHSARAQELGFSPATVAKMDLCQFFALSWLLQNLEYLQAARNNPRATVIAYEDLCRDPHAVSDKLFTALGWQRNARTMRFIDESTGRGLRAGLRQAFGIRAYYGVYKDPAVTCMAWRNRLTPDQRKSIEDILSAAPEILRYADFSEAAVETVDQRVAPQASGS